MPIINKAYSLSISPEQFLNACSDVEKQELALLLNKEEIKKMIQKHYNGLVKKVQEPCMKIMDMAESDAFQEWSVDDKLNLLHIVESALVIAKQIKERNEK